MSYKKSKENLEEDALVPDADIASEETPFSEDLDSTENIDVEIDLDDPIKTKEKNRRIDSHALKIRRAIEEHLEEKRMRKELDYLSKDSFLIDEDEKEDNNGF